MNAIIKTFKVTSLTLIATIFTLGFSSVSFAQVVTTDEDPIATATVAGVIPLNPNCNIWVSPTGANNSFTSIQAAIDTAAPNSTICLVGGIYRRTIDAQHPYPQAVVTVYNKPFQLLGGFPSVNSNIRNPSQFPSVIDGETLYTGISAAAVSSSLIDGIVIYGTTQGIGAGGTNTNLTINNVVFRLNRQPQGTGSALTNSNYGNVTITNCLFDSNTSMNGVLANLTATMTINKSTFINNTGRAIANSGLLGSPNTATMTIKNSLFVGNGYIHASTEAGTAIMNQATMPIINSTFALNNYYTTPAIYSWAYSNTTLKNVIEWDNNPFGNLGSEPYVRNVSYSITRNGYAGATNSSADPQFVGYYNNNFHLSASSPAINHGTNVDAPTDDRDSLPRDNSVDIGAYEYR